MRTTVDGKPKWYWPTYWHGLLGWDLPSNPKLVPDYKTHISSVYVMCAGDRAIKVGISLNPGRRARDIQTGQSDPVMVFWAVRMLICDAAETERLVHNELDRTAGKARGEWYYIAPETAFSVIERVIKEQEFDSVPDPDFGMFRDIREEPC